MAETKSTTTKDSGADKPVAPVPTQNKADDIREDAVGTEDDTTAKADAAAAGTGPTPTPTQTELDEIREDAVGGGKRKRKLRDMKAEDAGPGYKTR